MEKKKDNNIRVKNTLNASIEYLRKAASKNVTSAKKEEIRKSVYKGIY